MLTKSHLVLLVGSDVEVKKSTKVLGLTPLENSWMKTDINQHNTLQQCYRHALRQQDLLVFTCTVSSRAQYCYFVNVINYKGSNGVEKCKRLGK